MYLILLVTVLGLFVYGFFFYRARQWTLIDSFFLGVSLYQLGACLLILDVGLNGQSELIIKTSSLCFLVTCIASVGVRTRIASSVSAFYNVKHYLGHNEKFLAKGVILFLIGANALIAYVILTRFSDIFLSMEPGFLLDVRKKIASGERGFLAPGLIKQIRDIISPMVIAFIAMYLTGSRSYFLGGGLFAAVFFAVIVGGQRLPVIVLGGAVLVCLGFYRSNYFSARPRYLALGLFLIFISVTGLNYLLGRIEGGGILVSLYNTFKGVLWRAVQVVPYENYSSIIFVQKMDFPPFFIWMQELSSIVPGIRSNFSSELHANLGGSYEGNSVLGAALSSYFNAGFLGVILFPLFIILTLFLMELCFLGLRSKVLSAARVVLFFQIPLWYSPFLAVLNGGLAFAFLFFVVLLYKILAGFQRHREIGQEAK